MIALLQRVIHAHVSIEGERVASVGAGLLALMGVQPDDSEANAERLIERLLNYRVFADSAGKMNLSLRDVNGGLLLVPQFTLAADTSKGSRPGFSTAAPPELAKRLFDTALKAAGERHDQVQSGIFGANMQVSLTNDGPVTFWLES